MGGVLFIDEAYRLTPEDPGNDYGTEAVETLMQYLNPPPEQLASVTKPYPVMIFAGARAAWLATARPGCLIVA